MEHLFIVVWKSLSGIWHAEPNGVFTERRIAENFIECKKAAGELWELYIVEGSIVIGPVAEYEKRLGEF
jgi:hypothetical protein